MFSRAHPAHSAPANHDLHTWKEIAAYLSVTIRTAQAWEQERGLPVRRLPGERGQVFALSAEIDRWKLAAGNGHAADSAARGWPEWGRWVVAAVAVAALTGWMVWPKPAPQGFRISGGSIVAQDGAGGDLWRFALPDQYRAVDGPAPGSLMVRLVDLDGDGLREFLINAEASQPSRERNSLLICVSNSGSELWRFSPGRAVRAASEGFDPPYRIRDFTVIARSAPSASKVVVSSSHQVMYPNQVALLDARTGRVEREYWHSGALLSVSVHDADQDSRPELYLAGIHNGSRQATLVVLDPQTMAGASAEESAEYQLLDLKPGIELARVFFPRSCHAESLGQYNVALNVKAGSSAIEVDISEPLPDGGQAIFHYFLRPDLSLARLVEGDNYAGIHRSLRLSGLIDHDLSDAEREAKKRIRLVASRSARPGRSNSPARNR